MQTRLGGILSAICLAGAVLLGTAGCETEDVEEFFGMDDPKEALFVLSFHRVVNYPRGNAQAEESLRMANGKEVIIDRYPTLSSHHIVDATAEPIPGEEGFYRIYLKLDQKGRMMWMQLTGESRHDPSIILLDGIYFGEFQSQEISNGTELWVEFPLAVDGARAMNIVKYANDNYRFFNGGAKDDGNPFSINNSFK